MNIAVHIAFFYLENRLKYMTQILGNLSEIAAEHDVSVYVYTNKTFSPNQSFDRIKLKPIYVNFPKIPFAKKFQRFLPHSIKKYIDPYYLTWIHRKVVKDMIDDYDVQIYLEDDIGFTIETLQYWLTYKSICIENGYNLGFLRVELDERSGRWYCTDITELPDRVIELGGRLFAYFPGVYSAFWIYDREELKRFAATGRWVEHREPIRAAAAVGWHGRDLGMYKGTIVPVNKVEENTYVVSNESRVHHLPNNYIGHHLFCREEFPLRFKIG